MGRLTALQVKRAKPGRHGDGDGLYLVVSDSGSRKWVLRVQANGKRRDLGLGSAGDVSLSEARDAAADMRRAVRRGEDPSAERRRAREAIPTFREAAKMVHAEHRPSWKNPKHAAQWLKTLEDYAFPRLGDLPVNQIDGPLIRDVLAEIWLAIPETARRVRQRIGTVLDYAHAKGWRETETSLRSISRGLPKQPRNNGHFHAMAWQEVPAFVAGMAETLRAGETVRLALEFLILTAARSGEVRGARWSEIDLKEKAWSIPAERMKGGRAHRVPLSARAVEILERMKALRRTDDPDCHIFEGSKPGRPFSDMTMAMPIRRAALPITVHGFRSAFRDWAAESTSFPREVAEKALAHAVRDRVEAAYQRGDLFEKRREMMDAWALYCVSARSAGGKVRSVRQKAV
jgi:integrase